MIEPLRQRLRLGERPLRYLLAGGVNTLFGLGFFPAILWLSPWLARHYLVGLLIAQVVCVLFAFLTYKFGVFRTRTGIWRELGYFSSFYYAVFAVNLLVLPLLVEGWGLRPIPVQFAFSLIVLIGSYFWHGAVTFGPRTRS